MHSDRDVNSASTHVSGRKRPGLALTAVVVLAVLSLSACAASANGSVGAAPQSGFLMGLWHGAISPLTFIVSLFNPDAAIYEVRNSSHWYDPGFLLGCSIAFSGAARSRSRKDSDNGSSRRSRSRRG